MLTQIVISMVIFLFVGFNSAALPVHSTTSTRSRNSTFPYPKDWSRVRLVSPPRRSIIKGGDNNQPVYLAQYMYHWGSNCQGTTPDRTEANAFGACLGGMDENGNPIPSSYNTVLISVNTETSTVSYQSNNYRTTDCSGTPSSSYTVTQPLNTCVYDSMYVLMDTSVNPLPWSNVNDGIVVKTYPLTPDPSMACAVESYPEVFQSVSFNYCMGYYNPDYPTATNFRYTGCDSEKQTVTYSMYSDYSCSEIVKTVTFDANSCRVCPSSTESKNSREIDNDSSNCYPQGFWYRNYESISCGSTGKH